MAQIELKFESFEELVDFSKKILGVAEEQAHPVYKESKVTYGTQSATPAQQTPAAPVQVAPVAPVVPTVEHTYTLDDLANAAMTLMDKGMQTQLQNLLAGYGVEALPALPKNQYGNFATALRGMGANI